MAKRSRRARRQRTLTPTPAPTPAADPSPAQPVDAVPFNARTDVDFGREYYYVFSDLRNMLLIMVALFILMFALGYLI